VSGTCGFPQVTLSPAPAPRRVSSAVSFLFFVRLLAIRDSADHAEEIQEISVSRR
jgi:hypothetical protein